MTIQDAIDYINLLLCDELHSKPDIYSDDTYKFIEALEEFAIPALKKQIPMEHHHTIVGECHDEKARGSVCPNCLGYIVTVAEEFPRFCTWCGQAIDWEE